MPAKHTARTLIFSPHLDDAIFSLGACLARGVWAPVDVVTIFSRSRYMIDGLGSELAVTDIRMKEDRAVLDRVRARATYWGFPDASLRSAYLTEADYLNPTINVQSDCSWTAVRDHIVHEARREPCDLLLAPLGLGAHVDHRIVHEVCRELLSDGNPVAFYEDGSYAADSRDEIAHLSAAAGLYAWVSLRPEPFDAKLALVNMYESQVDANVRDVITAAYFERGEKVWSVPSVTDALHVRLSRALGNKIAYSSELSVGRSVKDI